MTVSSTVFDNGNIDVEQLELPVRSNGEVDVAISMAAICGSDMHTVLGHRTAPPRVALGHEGIGRVLAADEACTDIRGQRIRRGDRVVFALFSACGRCDRCAAGLAMKCRSLVKYGHESVTTYPYATGTLANQVRLIAGTPVLRIDDDVPDEQLVSAGCAVATAAAMVAAGGPITAGRRVLLFGVGALGAYCAAMLLSLGCEVHVSDPSERRLALAERLGAKPFRSAELAASAPFPLVVEASGSSVGFTEGLHQVDVGGRLVAAGAVSLGSTKVSFDPAVLVTRRITMVGVHNYSADDFAYGVDWLRTDGTRFDLSDLMSEPLPLTDVRAAFDLMRQGHYPRVLVRP